MSSIYLHAAASTALSHAIPDKGGKRFMIGRIKRGKDTGQVDSDPDVRCGQVKQTSAENVEVKRQPLRVCSNSVTNLQDTRVTVQGGGKKVHSAESDGCRKENVGMQKAQLQVQQRKVQQLPQPQPQPRHQQIVPQKRQRVVKKDSQAKEDVPVPEAKVREVEPMELSGLSPPDVQILLTRRPKGVDDVDALITDPYYNAIYAQDVITYTQSVEDRWVFGPNHLSVSPVVTPQMRAILIDWLIQVQIYAHDRSMAVRTVMIWIIGSFTSHLSTLVFQVHLELQADTLHLSVALIDKYLSLHALELPRLQLLGISSLFIAAKFYERFSPEISTLIHLTENTYVYDQLIDMERHLLRVLRFDLNFPTPGFFLERLFMIEENGSHVINTSYYLLDLCLVDLAFAQYPSSLRASAALYVSRRLFGTVNRKEPWTISLAYYSRYSEPQVLRCARTMARLLAKTQSSRFQGARIKHGSNSRHGSISSNPQLSDPELHHIFDYRVSTIV